MDFQTRKIEFVQSFLSIKDEKSLAQLELLLKKVLRAKKNEKFTIDELKSRIEESEKDYKNGNYKSSKLILRKYS